MKYVGLILLVALMVAAGIFGGPIAQIRIFSVIWLAGTAWLAFAKEIPFFLGDVQAFRLRGWAKLFIVLPALAIGLLLLIYAPEVSCLSYRRKTLCAQG
ncbi:hypothetical protein [Roseateles sp. P5_E1]